MSGTHGCYNAIGLWFLDGLAGLTYDASRRPPLAFRAAVEAASADLVVRGEREVPEGVAASSWSVVGGFTHNVTVPPNARARADPGAPQGDVTEGGAPVRLAAGVVVVGPATVNGVPYLEVECAAGAFRFALWH